MAERNKSSSPSDPRADRASLPGRSQAIQNDKTARAAHEAPADGPCSGRDGQAAESNGADVMGHEVPGAGDDATASFNDHVAALALCTQGEIRRANRSFVYAFGYDSAEELIAAGGLGRLFPTKPPLLFKPDGADDGRIEEVDATTRSRRRLTVPVVMHRVAPGDEPPVWMLVVRPGDAAYAIDALPVPPLDDPVAEATQTRDAEPAIVPDAQQKDDADGDEGESAGETAPAGDAGASVPVKDAVAPPALPEPARHTAAPPPATGNDHREADFLAKVSHDVRTPLNTIIGFAQLMKEERFGPVGNDRYRNYIGDILASGEHALGVINDLLDISSIEAGAFKLNFTSLDLRDLIADCTRQMQKQAKAERVLLRLSLPQDLPLVLADGHSMNQVLLTLLANAIEVTLPGGQVIVDVRRKRSGAIRLRVQDAGPGLSKAEITLAMEPFEPHDTAPRQQVGTGLGLPLTRALVQANRAKFKLASSAKSGTKVTLTFPADRVVQP